MKIIWISFFGLILFCLLFGAGSWSEGLAESGEEVRIVLSEEEKKALSPLTGILDLRPAPARPIESTSRLMPLCQGTWIYQITNKGGEKKRQRDLIMKLSHDGSRGSWKRIVGKRTIEYLDVRDDGNILLVSEIDLNEDVITSYTPPISIMINGMKPGEKRRTETRVAVYDLRHPSIKKYTGTLTVTHTYTGAHEVSVPAGKFHALLIKSLYRGKVGPAAVQDTGYVFYAENTGVVASIERMHVSAFLFYDKRTVIPKILLHATRQD